MSGGSDGLSEVSHPTAEIARDRTLGPDAPYPSWDAIPLDPGYTLGVQTSPRTSTDRAWLSLHAMTGPLVTSGAPFLRFSALPSRTLP